MVLKLYSGNLVFVVSVLSVRVPTILPVTALRPFSPHRYLKAFFFTTKHHLPFNSIVFLYFFSKYNPLNVLLVELLILGLISSLKSSKLT